MATLRDAAAVIVLIAAAGCGPSRDLAIVEEEAEATSTALPPAPITQAPSPTPPPAPADRPCGGEDGLADLDGEGGLPLLWCKRLSPEPGSTSVNSTDGSVPPPVPAPRPAAPPCGFFNFIGAVGVEAGPDEPALLYCDNDAGGGVRFVRLGSDGEPLVEESLLHDVCWPDTHSGDLAPRDGGYLALWSGWDPEDPSQTFVDVALLDQGGALEGEPWRLALPEGAWWPRVVGTRLLTADGDGGLWITTIDQAGQLTSEPTLVAEGVGEWDAAEVGEALFIATCQAQSRLVVLHVEGGAVQELALSAESTCGFYQAPSLASDGARAALAWFDDDTGHLALLDSSGELDRIELGFRSSLPQVAWDGQRWITAALDGVVQRYTPELDPDGLWRHPGLVSPPGTPLDLRVAAREGEVSFTLVAQDGFTSGEHVYTFHYLEQSAALLPEP